MKFVVIDLVKVLMLSFTMGWHYVTGVLWRYYQVFLVVFHGMRTVVGDLASYLISSIGQTSVATQTLSAVYRAVFGGALKLVRYVTTAIVKWWSGGALDITKAWEVVLAYFASTPGNFRAVWSAVSAYFVATAARFKAVWGAVYGFFASTGANFRAVWGGITYFLQATWSNAVGMMSGVWEYFGSLFHGFAAGVSKAFGGVIGFFRNFGSNVNAVVTWLGDRFKEFKDLAIGAFQGIWDALSVGDLDLTMKILWGTLKVAWYLGVNALTEIYTRWGFKVVEFFYDMKGAVQSAFIDMWAGIRTVWIVGMAGLKIALQVFVGGVLEALAPLADVLPGDLAQKIAKARASVGSPLATGVGAAREVRDVDKEREKEQEHLARVQRVARLKRAAANAKMGSGVQDELAQAQEDLQAYESQAAAARRKIKPIPTGPAGQGIWDPDEMERAVAKAEVRSRLGVITASTAFGMGAGETTADRTLKEQKKSNELLGRIEGKVDRVNARFGTP
jgi:hypothetical protein